MLWTDSQTARWKRPPRRSLEFRRSCATGASEHESYPIMTRSLANPTQSGAFCQMKVNPVIATGGGHEKKKRPVKSHTCSLLVRDLSGRRAYFARTNLREGNRHAGGAESALCGWRSQSRTPIECRSAPAEWGQCEGRWDQSVSPAAEAQKPKCMEDGFRKINKSCTRSPST